MLASVARRALLVFTMLLPACAEQFGTNLAIQPPPPAPLGNLGKVHIMLTTNPDTAVASGAAAVPGILHDALARLPNTEPLATPAAWGATVSDADAIAAGKAAGADTVCLFTLTNYDARFCIGLPVPFSTDADILYSLRLLDVHSGALLHASLFARHDGGAMQITNPDDRAKHLAAMLEHDLASRRKPQ